ncbi:MAG: hypothetical protein ACJAXE_002010, partial [Neolewinella sp.]
MVLLYYFFLQIRSAVEKGEHERTSNKRMQKYHKNQHLKIKVHPTEGVVVFFKLA